jgi:aryl-alcohol dehydrogenase-like predicted oxidoreductase
VEREYAPIFEKHGMGATTWSPLHSGILTGKYNDGIPADSRMSLKGYEWLRQLLDGPDGKRAIHTTKKLGAVAADLGTSLARLAIAWCVKNPRVSSVITGASRVEQVRDNMEAIHVVPRLTPDVMRRIDDILRSSSS